MNPDFRYFVSQARELGVHVIDRCNLTILLANGYQDMADFLAEHDVEIVASLPCYLESNTDNQRGDGAYRQSIEALKKLNTLGYGLPDSNRSLTLVYNPVGPSLPPSQQALEADYRKVLREQHGIEFSRLFTITNMPISRFLEAPSALSAAFFRWLVFVAVGNPGLPSGALAVLNVAIVGRAGDAGPMGAGVDASLKEAVASVAL